MTKRVSIVVCTYNGAEYLREQLDSLLAQTYPLYEIIVQDDRSTDDTWQILQQYRQQYPNLFRIEQNAVNLDWNQNFLHAILKASGEYIACCDQDDIWEKDKIETQINEIGDNWLHVCSSYMWVGKREWPYYSEPCNLSDVFLKYPYCGHQFLFTRDLLPCIEVGIKADMSHDRLLSFVAVYKRRIITSRYLGVHWRRHEGTASGTGISPELQMTGTQKIKYTIKAFIHHRTSPVIARAFNKYDIVMTYLDATDGSYPNSRTFLRLFRCLKHQTVWSYLQAGSCYLKLRKEIWGDKRLSLRLLYEIFTYPFRWWYVQKDNV